MAFVHRVEMVLPAEVDRWRPAMVWRANRAPMVEVLLHRNRCRVKRAYRDTIEVDCFRGLSEEIGVKEAITRFPSFLDEFELAKRSWLCRLAYGWE